MQFRPIHLAAGQRARTTPNHPPRGLRTPQRQQPRRYPVRALRFTSIDWPHLPKFHPVKERAVQFLRPGYANHPGTLPEKSSGFRGEMLGRPPNKVLKPR
jgi:hypothetical protein